MAAFLMREAGRRISNKSKLSHEVLRAKSESYRYYFFGLGFKILGVLVFGYTYLEAIGYGDTVAYFESSFAIGKVIFKDPVQYFEVLFGEASDTKLQTHFDQTYKPYRFLYLEPRTCMVLRLTSVFVIISGGSFLVTSALIASLSFGATWLVYQVLIEKYPKYSSKFLIPLFFMPSVAFYATGVLKDSYTYIGFCLVLYGTYRAFIDNRKIKRGLILLLIGTFLIITIKPYVLFGLLPACIVWVFHNRITRIKGVFFKLILLPVLFLILVTSSAFFFTYMGSSFGKFSADQALETAAVTHNDLKKDYYGGHAFDIGDFDGTPGSALSLFVPATIAGIYRPFIFETRSPLLLITALENTYLLFLLFAAFRYSLNPFKIVRTIGKEPVVMSFLLFTVLFGFVIGLSTSNFGALVRFKVPLIPVYGAAMIIIIQRLRADWRRRGGKTPSNS